MRKIIAIAVALGFLASTSLPTFATPAVNGVVKSDELSAASHVKKKTKKKKTDKMEKKSDLLTTDMSAASHVKMKKKTKKKKADKMEKK